MADVIEYLLSELNTMNWVNARRNRHSVSVDLTLDDNPKTALQQLGLVQGKLRIIKREASTAMTSIRQQHRQRISVATYTPGVGGALLGAKYRAAARRAAAVDKRHLTQQREAALAPYAEAKNAIDQLLVQIDGKKLEIKSRSV